MVPAYNEEKRLPPGIHAILRWLKSRRFDFAEVVVVDDGSRDGTAGYVEGLSVAEPLVRLVRNPGNRGKGYAVRHGVQEARGEWILSTDADLSAPIEEADQLQSAAERERAAVAIGSRALDRSLIGVHQPAFREYAGRFFNLVMRIVMRLPFRDTQCGFKLFRADAAREIFRRQQLDGFGFDVEDLFIARKLGYRTIEVPVRWNDVKGTKVGAFSGLKAFADLARIRWYQLCGRYRFRNRPTG